MTETVFFRLLADEDKGEALAEQVIALRAGDTLPDVYDVDPESFAQVPGTPFAYWVSEKIRRLFVDLPSFEGEGRIVRVGLQTSDDFRFVRTWWEVHSKQIVTGDIETTRAEFLQQTFDGKSWAGFPKGGDYFDKVTFKGRDVF